METGYQIGPNYIYEHSGIAVPYLTIICIATLLGTVGNCLVIAAVMIDKNLRTVGNMFIVNLAIADLSVTAVVDPFSIIGIVRGELWFEERPALCEFIASLCLTSCFCSLLSIGAISLNRYIHICHHHLYQKLYTFRNTLLMCFGLWTISFLAEMPNFLGWGDHVYDRKTLSCVWDRTADFSYTVFFSSVGVAFPVFLISVCYCLIFKHVRDSKKKVGATVDNNVADRKSVDSEKQSRSLARTLFLIFVVFAVCWSPYAVIVVADHKDSYPQELHIFSILIAHTNSSLNSILYGVTNKNFRYAYFRILGITKCMEKLLASNPEAPYSTTLDRPKTTIHIIEKSVEDDSHFPTCSTSKSAV